MIVLGIESTAHTYGIGIIKVVRGRCVVLANERSLFTTKSGGMIPAQVAQHHIDNADTVLKSALQKAKIQIADVDLIAYSQSPGLGHTLKIGGVVARTLALKLDTPIVGVNHCVAHLEIGRALTKAKDPILVYASGANTQIIAYEAGKYRIFGETLDIGIGNFLDALGRAMGLGFPGGPQIDTLAKKGKKLIELPYVVKGMDMSFGGILTNLKQKIKKKEHKDADLCYSAQETVFAMMTEVAERALAHCDKKEILLGGGVACNTRLQEMMHQMCKDRNAKCYVLENQFNVDNGVMIAWLGYEMFSVKKKGIAISKAGISPYVRTDDVKVTWR